MPFSSFSFNASTGGVPTANFTFPVGAVPPGSFIYYLIANDTIVYTDTPTDNAGDVGLSASGFWYFQNSIGDPALTISLNNLVAANFEILGVVLSGVDNVLGPFDQEALQVANCSPPPAVFHTTAAPLICPGGTIGPITPLFAATALLASFQGDPGSAPAFIFPAPNATFSGTLSDFAIALQYPAPIAAYDASCNTGNTAGTLVFLDIVVLPVPPPATGTGLLPLLGVGN